MDDKVAALLAEWDFQNLQSIFEENMIDMMALRLLGEEDLKNLIPQIGVRAKFRHKWKAWFEGQHAVPTFQDSNFGEVLNYIDSSGHIQKVGGNMVILETENIGGPSTSFEIPLNLDQSPNFSSDQESLTQMLTNKSNSEHNAPSTSTIVHDGNISSECSKNFVSNVLSESVDGKALMLLGNKQGGQLKERERKELGRLVIRKLMQTEPQYKLQCSAFLGLAHQIVQIFPKENAAVYFMPSLPLNKFQRKRNASGILYEAYISRRKKLRQLGELPRSARSRSSSSSSAGPPSPAISTHSETIPIDLEDNPILEEHITWLLSSVEPWALVEIYWGDTALYRLHQIETGNNSIAEYFSKYPALRQHQGYKLLLQDFNIIHPNHENSLYAKLVIVQPRILTVATERIQSARDTAFKNQLQIYLDVASNTKSTNNLIATLLLIPYLLPVPPCTKKPGLSTWKPSRTEVRDGFITHVASDADVQVMLESRKAKYQTLGRTFQPLVIIVGPSLDDIQKFFVVVNTTLYILGSGIEAVDVAFKIFHATSACYPEEAVDVWTLIQYAFYQIKTKYDRISQGIRRLTSDLQLTLV